MIEFFPLSVSGNDRAPAEVRIGIPGDHLSQTDPSLSGLLMWLFDNGQLRISVHKILLIVFLSDWVNSSVIEKYCADNLYEWTFISHVLCLQNDEFNWC